MVGLLPAGFEETEVFEFGKGALKKSPNMVSTFTQRAKDCITYIVFDSSSSSPLPAIALNADHKSLTFISAPDSRYI